MVGCGQTSARWLPSTMPSPPSTQPNGPRERRSSAFIRERHARIDTRGRPALSGSIGCIKKVTLQSYYSMWDAVGSLILALGLECMPQSESSEKQEHICRHTTRIPTRYLASLPSNTALL